MKPKTDNKKLIDENLKQQNLLDVSNLSVLFKMQGTYFKAVNNISFKVNKGDFFGIVGESGSGKSTTGKSIVRLNVPSGGKISFDGKIISTKKIKKTNKKFLQNNIQMIFQDPMASLNYSKNVLQLISEPLVINKTIRKKSLLLKKNFDLIYRYYWAEFLEEYTNLYRKFMLDYWNDLVKAYKSSLESNDTIDFNIRIDLLVENYWKSSNFIEKYLNKREELFQKYIALSNKEISDNVYWKYYKLIDEIKDVNKAVKISPENLKLNFSDILKKYKKEYDDNKNLLIDSGIELLKNWKIELNSSIKVQKQKVSLTKNYVSHVYNYVNRLELKAQKLFCVYFVKKLSHLKSKDVLDIMEKVENICRDIYADIVSRVLKHANQFSEVSPSLKSKEINFLKEEKKYSYAVYLSIKNLLSNNEQNNLSYEKLISDFKTKNQNITDKRNEQDYLLMSQKIFDEIKKFLENYLSINGQNLLKWNEIEKEFEQKNLDLKNTYEKNKNLFKDNSNLFNELSANLENKNKELNSLKEEVKQTKALQKELLKKKLDSKSYREELTKLKKEKEKLEKLFAKKYKEYLNNNFSNKESWDKNEKLITVKKWKYYINNIKVLDSFKNFSVRESYYYKFAHLFKGPLKYLFIPLFRNNEKRNYVYKALESVGLKKEHAYRYPHEFSGGQRQRIVIARALITNPKLVIADEPISALDVSIQAQVINIMKKLADEKGITFLFIAHDLSMVNHVCNKLIIMHRGKILEGGEVDEVFKNPTHPYTQSLMKAVPKLSRIHVDLASFEENQTYDLDYSLVNIPKYFDIKPNNKHYIFGTESQIKEWTQK